MTTTEVLYVLKESDTGAALNKPMTLSETVKFLENSDEMATPMSESLLSIKQNDGDLAIYDFGKEELSDDELDKLYFYYFDREVNEASDRDYMRNPRGPGAEYVFLVHAEDDNMQGSASEEWGGIQHVAYPQPLPLTEKEVGDYADSVCGAELVRVES